MYHLAPAAFRDYYNAYQKRYRTRPRESDRVLLEMVEEVVGKRDPAKLALLDVGCSTGNLLFHLKQKFPKLSFSGSDIDPSAVELCRENKDLENISFDVRDITNLNYENRFDIITGSAVISVLSALAYKHAVKELAKALKPGGWLLLFDYYHPFQHDIEIVETFPETSLEVRLYFRSYRTVDETMGQSGFKDLEFRPFQIPIDLELPGGGGAVNYRESLESYTVKTAEDERLVFRGTLCQPWCHARARRGD